MKLAGGILQYELLVWMRNVCTENRFDLDSVKEIRIRCQRIKKNKLNKDHLVLFFSVLK